MKELRTRKPNRLKGYNYSKSGLYFITICSKNREEIFGSVGATVPGRPHIIPQPNDISGVNGTISMDNAKSPNGIISTNDTNPPNRTISTNGTKLTNGIISTNYTNPPNRTISTNGTKPTNGIISTNYTKSSNGIISTNNTKLPNGIISTNDIKPSNGITTPNNTESKNNTIQKEDNPKPKIILTEIGEVINNAILHNNRDGILIETYVIMPNHIHMILIIQNKNSNKNFDMSKGDINTLNGNPIQPAGDRGRSPLQMIIRNMKSYVTKEIGFSPWQKSFHDHIIRNEIEHRKIFKYIENNPENWENDCFYNAVL